MQSSLYIHGRYVEATSGQTFANINPANGEKIADVGIASEKDMEDAIESAKKGFAQWSAMSNVERSRILHEAARLLREHNDELALIEVIDTGKPLQEAEVVDVASGADCIEYYANLCASLHGEQHDLPGGAMAYTRREPLGICLGIGAWNYPLQIACWKSAPALACGNAMIFKPSEVTPTSALKLAEIYSKAGVPDGVFNVLQGEAPVGQYLTEHNAIAKVSLTGEVNTGKKVMASAAKTLKNVTMELGGKSPLIIFDDASLDNAVSAAMMANFYTQGEICSNGTRVFVHENIKDKFLDKLKSRVEKMVIGDPQDKATQVGSQISMDHLKKVMGYIEMGKAEGAVLVSGGKQRNVESCPQGAFVEPTVFADCHDDMTIVKEEIFGPVMSVLTFRDEKEVLERANNIDEGLAAGVFTNDLTRAHRMVAKLQAGICWINNYNITPIEIPFGGFKNSGIGRENGLVTIEHYTQIKSVYIEMGDVDCPYT